MVDLLFSGKSLSRDGQGSKSSRREHVDVRSDGGREPRVGFGGLGALGQDGRLGALRQQPNLTLDVPDQHRHALPVGVELQNVESGGKKAPLIRNCHIFCVITSATAK